MSSLTDRSQPASTISGARQLARLVSRGETPANDTSPASAPVQAAAPVETVTLGKIGDFLELDFERLFTWLRQGLWFALALAVLGAIAGGAYAVLTPPRYTVSTDILIDPANLQVVNDDLFQQPGQTDSALLNAGSKLRVLTSGNVLMRVVDELNLTADKEFYDPEPAGFSLSALLPSGGERRHRDRSAPRRASPALSSKVGTAPTRPRSSRRSACLIGNRPTRPIRISRFHRRGLQGRTRQRRGRWGGRAAPPLRSTIASMS